MRSSPVARSSARALRTNCREAFLRVLGPVSEIWFTTLNSSLLNTVWGLCGLPCEVPVRVILQANFGNWIANRLQPNLTLRAITPEKKSTTCISTRIELRKRLVGSRNAESVIFDEKKSKCQTELRHFLDDDRSSSKELFAPKG